MMNIGRCNPKAEWCFMASCSRLPFVTPREPVVALNQEWAAEKNRL